MPVIRYLQSSALDVRHSVEEILLKQPRRERGRCKTHVASGYAKKENLLPCRENPCAKNFREYLAKPSSASEHKELRAAALLFARYTQFQPSRSRWLEDYGAAKLHT